MPTQIKLWASGLGLLVVSFLVGNAVAEGDYSTLGLLVLLILVVATIVMPGYEPILAFGILCPFAFPIPYVFRFPFFGLVLGLCCVKFVVTQALSQKRLRYHLAATAPILILFGWVVLRYCINPVMPGLAIGTGSAVTGFRGYLNYAACLGLLLTLPLFIKTRDDVVRLLRWLAYISLLFAALLITLTLSKSLTAARILTNLGMTVVFFDNGWLRFVSLPGFGLILLTVSLLPHVMPLRRWQQILFIGIALVAVILGGNRSSLGMAMIILLCVSLVRRKVKFIAATVMGIAATLVAFYFIGENMTFRSGVGFYRVLALVSPRAAEHSEASQTIVWRKLRWDRAIEDIKKEPWIGMGYGGLAAIFAYGNLADLEQNLVEIDVASGSIHNGFLAGARAFGIPFLVMFVAIMLHCLIKHGGKAIRLHRHAPLQSELHTLVFATLATMVIAIYFGIDLNYFLLWFFIGLGGILSKLQPENQRQERNEHEPARHSPPESVLPMPLGAFRQTRL